MNTSGMGWNGRPLDLQPGCTPAGILLKTAGEMDACLYALVDAARHDALFAFLAEADLEWSSLFQGTGREHLLSVGPVLLRCPVEEDIIERLITEVCQRQGLVFILCTVARDMLAGHLKTLLQAVTEDDRELFFRCYDPRILPAYLESCCQEELWRFFGPVASFAVLKPGAQRCVVFARDEIGGDPACLDRQPPAWRQRLFFRNAQLTRFRQCARETFADRMQRHLADRYGAGATDVEFDEIVRQGIARSAMYGIKKEFDVQRYLECMLTLGPDFDLAETDEAGAWAGRILFRTELTGTEKMNAIDAHALCRCWG